MSDAVNPIEYYDQHGRTSAAIYDRVNAASLHAWMTRFLPKEPGVILDIGAGSGRDAHWLADQGHTVIAVEPSRTMREHAFTHHAHERIQWVNDALPSLEQTYQLQYAYDVVLVNAVWMFIPPRERIRAFRKLVDLLKPGGVLVMTAQLGEVDPKNGKLTVPDDELVHLATQHGLQIEVDISAQDSLGRDYRWQQVVFRVPDDGTGAMPFLRRLVLDDRKSATYKLGLLRTIVRIAESAPGFAKITNDGQTAELPFGLFGLFWLRLYLPLTQGNFPQSAANRSAGTALSFAGDAYNALPTNVTTDLYIGNTLTGDRAALLARAIKDACDCIEKMPAHFITFDDGRQVFTIERQRTVVKSESVHIDESFLQSFGTVKMSRHIWMSIARFGFWIEPSLILEWQRLMNGYAFSQGRQLDPIKMNLAMEWADLQRDQLRAKKYAQQMQAKGHKLYCIWSGKELTQTYDIDHILPWAAWPCGDLWNLVPADRALNQAEKRAKLVSAALLDRAKERMFDYWTNAYLNDENANVPRIFYEEAQASLTIRDLTLSSIHNGIRMRRVQLRIDQQIPEFNA
ncbi:MAG: hypothetical protein RLY87_1825 [Chloroflexota bacterium]|jgi:SAM-dependent methyltransferase